jgi:urease beta subunit
MVLYTTEARNVKIQIGSVFHFLDKNRRLYETLSSEGNPIPSLSHPVA